jgi:CBS domain-containing protein
MRARELMSTPVVVVRPETTLKEVAEQMASHRVSGMPVVDHRGHLVGIISESDVLLKLESHTTEARHGVLSFVERLGTGLAAEQKPHARTAAELMTTSVISAGLDASFRELVHLMTAHDVNRIPIVDQGHVIGIITRADLLRTLTRRDAAVSEDARWRILHDLWIDTAGLDISTRHGIVMIAGEVGTRSEADLIRRWIAAMEGVVDVDLRNLRYRADDRHVVPAGGIPGAFLR